MLYLNALCSVHVIVPFSNFHGMQGLVCGYASTLLTDNLLSLKFCIIVPSIGTMLT